MRAIYQTKSNKIYLNIQVAIKTVKLFQPHKEENKYVNVNRIDQGGKKGSHFFKTSLLSTPLKLIFVSI